MAAKKQIDQDSLRRLMRQKKNEMTMKKVDHPFAKYNSLDQLICSLCQSRVKSAALWNAHLMSRSHKENSEAESARKRAEDLAPPPTKIQRTSAPDNTTRPSGAGLQSLVDFGSSSEEEEEKQKATTKTKTDLPSDFFSSSSGLTARIRRRPKEKKKEEEEKREEKEEKKEESMAERLPEGFFDDPVKDAEVRQVPYQSKIDDEVNVFQKAMKEMTQESEAIIEEEDKINEVERSLSNIDELMTRWRRINELEIRKDAIAQQISGGKEEEKEEEEEKETKMKSKVKKEEESSSEEEADPDDTAVLWRAKRMV